MIRLFHVVGARPNFMKIAPIVREMLKYPDQFQQILVHTGQHYDDMMSKIFFDDLELPKPDIYLEVGSGSHAQQTAQIMSAFEPVLLKHGPDLIIVVGDVNSTIACSLVATKMGIQTVHVEAGLRSFDRTMPEEINRLLTDQISDLLFVSEPSGLTNLRQEGITEQKIHFVGNLMIDSLLHFREKALQSSVLDRFGLSDSEYIILTLHRPSNVDNLEPFKNILNALIKISEQIPVIFPVHPRTRKMISEFGLEKAFFNLKDQETPIAQKGINLVDPLGYLDFYKLMMEAKVVLTDSGGIQEETTFLGIPCLTLRENTERPVTVTEGTNIVVGTDPKTIYDECFSILRNGGKKGNIPKFWDGKTAQRIVDVLIKMGNG